MGIALQTAIREAKKRQGLPVFELRLVQLPHFGDACAIFVVAKNPIQARLLVAKLYTTEKIPDHLKEASYSLSGVEKINWRSSRLSNCRKTERMRLRAGIIRIETRKKN